MAAHHGVGHVEAIDENFVPVEYAIAVRVLVNRNDVRAASVVRWWRRDLVVVRAIILVAAQHDQPGRIRILPVLRNPKPPAFVEAEVRRLRDQWLAQKQLRYEIRAGPDFRCGFGWQQARPMHLRGTTEHPV